MMKSRNLFIRAAAVLFFSVLPVGAFAALELHLPLDNSPNDASGNGRNATLLNGPTYGTGVMNQAIVLDGTNDYLRVPAFNPGGTFSTAMWVRMDATDNIRTFIEYNKNNNRDDFFFGIENGQVFIELEDTNTTEGGPCGGAKICTGVGLVPNRWYHLAMVVTPTTWTLYVNGEVAATQSHTRPVTFNTPGVWLIGGDSDGNPYDTADSDWFDGRMDDVRVYSHALTQVEVAQLMGLRGFWKFDECAWTGAAGEVLDASGNGLHGTRAGSAATAAGRVCTAASLNGTTDYINVPDNALLDLGSTLTVGAWVYPDAIPGSGLKTIVSKDENYEFHINNQGRIYWWWNNSSGTTRSLTSTGAALTAGNWYHIAIVYEPGRQAIYINGVERGSSSYNEPLMLNADPLQIGADQGFAGRQFDGLIDEVKIYARAIGTEELAGIMADTGRTCPNCTPPAQLAYYAMDEALWNGTADEIRDGSGNNNHAVRVGAATTVANGRVCRGGDIPNNTSTSAINTNLNVATAIGGRGSITFWYNGDTAWNNGTARTLLDASNNLGNEAADKYFFLVKEGGGRLRFRLEDSADTDSQARTSANTFPANTWVHIGVTWDLPNDRLQIYINGALRATSTTNLNGTPGNWATLYLGDNRMSGVSGNGYTTNSANGILDEARIYNYVRTLGEIQADMNATHACGNVDHFAIAHAGTGVTCQAENVTITAHDALHNPVTSYTGTISLSTGTLRGDWTVVTGAGALLNGAANDGAATYTFAAADSGVAVLALKHTVAGTVNINVADGAVTETSGAATAAEDPALVFAEGGFRFINAAGLASVANQVAGQSSAVHYLQAIRTDTSTGACVGVFGAGQTVSIELASQCNDPVTCAGRQVAFTNNAMTTALAGNPDAAVSSYSTVPVTFLADGSSRAAFTVNYPDVGRISLHARYNMPLGTGAPSGNYMTGSSNPFVVRPGGFALSNIVRTADSFANPGALDETGPVFMRAGENFTATVTAVTVDGATATPNYGRETVAETVRLVPTLLAPAAGNNPAISNATAFGAFTNGVATGTTFGWGEVGIITLAGEVGDSDYLGAGNVTGASTGNVGRFTPYDFSVSYNAPRFTTACATGNFTYVGQPFRYVAGSEPVMTVTARNGATGTTQNYSGVWWKMTDASLTGRSYTAATGTLDTGALPSPDPVIADLGGGTGTLAFGSGATGLAFTRAAPVAPFDAEISLAINVIDTDGIAYAGNPARFGQASAGNGIAFDNGKAMRYGRLNLTNAFGSELLPLPMPMRAQYYVDATTGFVTNTADVCTSIALSSIQLTSAVETVTADNPIRVKGVRTTTASIATPFAAGDAGLSFSAPGAGGDGYVDVTPTTPSYLQFDWDGDSAYDDNPTARANFGVYRGSNRQIYLRERF
jgi:MSHA biogenesis protein MshQ